MTNARMLCLIVSAASLMSFAQAANMAYPRVDPADARTHAGETAMVCGKVVDSDIQKNAIRGYGFPVSLYLDGTQANPLFYFIAFGTEQGGPEEAVAAYAGKRICVTGKIAIAPSGGPPFILAARRSQIKAQPDAK